MMRSLLLVGVLFAVPVVPLAQSASSPVITTQRLSSRSPARYVTLVSGNMTMGNPSVPWRWVYPFKGTATLHDVVVNQVVAGTGGTSTTVAVRKNGSVDMLATNATVPLSAGALAVLDMRGELALPSGATRPVAKTDGSETITKGDVIYVYSTESGTYSPHATFVVTLVLRSLDH